jgi:flagellar basal body-associated protein FliL
MSDKAETPKEEAKAEGGKPAAGGEHAAPAGGGGIKAFLPLIIAAVLMPVMAFVTTQFVIIPKVVKARDAAHAEGDEHGEHAEGEGHGEEAGGHGAKEDKGGHGAKEEKAGHGAKEEKGGHAAKEDKGGHGAKEEKGGHGAKGGKGKKQSYQVSKLIVNVSGTAGTRYLMTSATLVGNKPDFKDVLEENKDQLLDLTISALSTKTIADLEKPGARNQIRSELISVYNNALGANLVQEIYFTEFAIQ